MTARHSRINTQFKTQNQSGAFVYVFHFSARSWTDAQAVRGTKRATQQRDKPSINKLTCKDGVRWRWNAGECRFLPYFLHPLQLRAVGPHHWQPVRLEPRPFGGSWQNQHRAHMGSKIHLWGDSGCQASVVTRLHYHRFPVKEQHDYLTFVQTAQQQSVTHFLHVARLQNHKLSCVSTPNHQLISVKETIKKNPVGSATRC